MAVRRLKINSWTHPDMRPIASVGGTGKGFDKPGTSPGVDLVTIVAACFLLFIALNVVTDRHRGNLKSDIRVNSAEAQSATLEAVETLDQGPIEDGLPSNKTVIEYPELTYPYDRFTLTQGPHGFSYGHMAIDLAAGKGETIRSPITGIVTASYVDIYGNTTLVIENGQYQVTLLHGQFHPSIGDEIAAGHPVGVESNQGYTTDMQGRSCRNRDCGYHTHLNIFDKSAGQNVNPLAVLKSTNNS